MPTFGKDPREFIRHNLLTLEDTLHDPPARLLRSDGTVWVKLSDITGKFDQVNRNRNRKGLAKLMPKSNETWWTKPTHIFEVVPASPFDDDGFAAYICPYAPNTTGRKMLGSDADVMFTADMDGCTFGIGIPNSLGEVRVGHANAMNQATGSHFNPNYGPQRAAQTNSLQASNLSQTVLDPSEYRDNAPQGSELRAVTIGLRIKGVWEFWYQHHHADGDDYRNKVATTKLQ